MTPATIRFDSHVHVVSPDRARYPVAPTGIGTPWWQDGRRTVEAFRDDMVATGVDRAVLVQAVGPYGFDNAYVLDAAAGEPRFSVVVAVDLDADDAESEIRRLAVHPSVTGVRFFGMTDARDWISPATTARYLATAADCGLSVVLTVAQDDLSVLRPAIEASPAAIALDHCGFPEYDDGEIRGDQCVLSLADVPGVHLKVTTNSFQHSGDPGRLLAQLLGHFGAERLLWGSDHPQTHDCYADCVALAAEACRDLTEQEQHAYLGANTSWLFGLGDEGGRSAASLDLAAVGEVLHPLVEALAADGYLLEVRADGADHGVLRLDVRPGPDACADCLVPKSVFAGIAADRLGDIGITPTIELRYPADLQDDAGGAVPRRER